MWLNVTREPWGSSDQAFLFVIEHFPWIPTQSPFLLLSLNPHSIPILDYTSTSTKELNMTHILFWSSTPKIRLHLRSTEISLFFLTLFRVVNRWHPTASPPGRRHGRPCGTPGGDSRGISRRGIGAAAKNHGAGWFLRVNPKLKWRTRANPPLTSESSWCGKPLRTHSSLVRFFSWGFGEFVVPTSEWWWFFRRPRWDV